MKTEPTVYVILLNWNGWLDTIVCLDSVASLNYINYRVLVVDNGSTNDSVVRISAAHPYVPIIETGRNLGFSGGCNVGIRRALEEGAKYVWLLNNDTTVDNHALSAMITEAENNDKIGAIGSVIYHMDFPDKIQAWGGGWVSIFTGRAGHYLNSTPKIQYITGTSMLLRCKALEKIGLLDEKNFFMYWEDVDLSSRMKKSGFNIAVAEASKVLHRESSSAGKNSDKLDYYYNESAIRFFRKNIRMSVWPIFIGACGRISMRIVGLKKKRISATIMGSFAGIMPKKHR